MSSRVRTRSRNWANRDAHSKTSTGTESSNSASASTALLICFRVTVWISRLPSLSTSASRKSKMESFKPISMRGSIEVFWIRPRQAFPRTSKCPARFPLSTEETYLGSRGFKSRVSYQLNKWPRNDCNCLIVANVASIRSTASSVPSHPKSRAAIVESRYMPTLVGEVRCATIGFGVS